MTKRILLVDNVDTFRRSLSRFLEQAGYSVIEAETCEQARRIMTDRWIHLAILFRVALIALHNFVEKLVANRQCILDIQPPVHGVQKEFHHRQYFIGIYADLPQFSGLLSIY